jgi:hypothetical protein
MVHLGSDSATSRGDWVKVRQEQRFWGIEPMAGLSTKTAMVFWAGKRRGWRGSGKGGTRFFIDAME